MLPNDQGIYRLILQYLRELNDARWRLDNGGLSWIETPRFGTNARHLITLPKNFDLKLLLQQLNKLKKNIRQTNELIFKEVLFRFLEFAETTEKLKVHSQHPPYFTSPLAVNKDWITRMAENFHSHIIYIHCSSYCEKISCVEVSICIPQGLEKSSSYELFRRDINNSYLVTLTLSDETIRYLYISDFKEKGIELTNAIRELHDAALPLGLVEYGHNKNTLATHEKKKGVYNLAHWNDGWDPPMALAHYEYVSHVLILDALLRTVISQNPPFLKIIDIGAGKGTLAIRILRLLEALGIQYEYIFIEPSSIQIKQAQESLCGFVKGKITFISMFFSQATLQNPIVKNADVIISSGGPFNLEVVKCEVAYKNARLVHRMLKS
ncbi:MAG: SAM-dependent methyltransferase, partial [Gammaproteobacteria bacterium]|nr:SAM-dependent methyltransferase [Gammaproteobacteria bacterium]